MRAEHLTDTELAAYGKRALAPVDALEISDHLAGCDECRELARRAAVGAESDKDWEVTYEELAALVDDELDPIEARALQTRISRLPAAQRELADLVLFRKLMDAGSTEDVAPATPPRNVVPGFFGRWALPLAAALAVSAGGLWWSVHSRAQAFVRLRDHGQDVRFNQKGESRAWAKFSPSLRHALKDAVTHGKIEVPTAVIALAGRKGTLAGNASAEPVLFRVLAPIATAVRDGKPQFRWSRFPDADAYRIHVVSLSTGELMITETLRGDQATWTPSQSLADGQTYEWEIEALRGEQVIAKAPVPPQPEARFAVISTPQRDELAQVRGRSGGSHLALGVANAQAGLLDDAMSEFAALATENPDAPIPQKLCDELARRRLPR